MLIGLTGGIASGKTAVTDILRELGYPVIDLDEVSRAITAPGTDGERLLMNAFPSCVASGRLSRRALRALIFSDASARARLNDVMRVPLQLGLEVQLLAKADEPKLFVSVPLLVETGMQSLFDRIWTVYAPAEVRINRLTARDTITREEACAAIAAQATDGERAAAADEVIVNDGALTALRERVAALAGKA
ncbi:MAG: dephospho-CoA kinase [Clostridiales bacterium]|jgi:dephospho-CoA kinase|nr:dephospho-CoA kinase [Clostridiales bacterium]